MSDKAKELEYAAINIVHQIGHYFHGKTVDVLLRQSSNDELIEFVKRVIKPLMDSDAARIAELEAELKLLRQFKTEAIFMVNEEIRQLEAERKGKVMVDVEVYDDIARAMNRDILNYGITSGYVLASNIEHGTALKFLAAKENK